MVLALWSALAMALPSAPALALPSAPTMALPSAPAMALPSVASALVLVHSLGAASLCMPLRHATRLSMCHLGTNYKPPTHLKA